MFENIVMQVSENRFNPGPVGQNFINGVIIVM